ncbi:MAG: hypothetical protein U0359_00395 [Byssovorax sp.]
MRASRLLAGLVSLSVFVVARVGAAATFSLTPSSPSSNPGPTLSVTGLPHSTTVSLYLTAGCSGAVVQQKSTTLITTGLAFSNIAVSKNATTALSAKVGSSCVYGTTYRHDDIPPAKPVFTSLQSAAPNGVLTGTTEAGAVVRLYSDATCGAVYLAPVTADASGRFTFVLPAGSPAPMIHARATDAAANTSACSNSWISWAPEHAEECPALAADVPVSRPPVYAYLEGGDRFFSWKDECHGSRASCPPIAPNDPYAGAAFPYPSSGMSAYYGYMDIMKPALVQTQGGSPAIMPFAWGQGPLGEQVDGSQCGATVSCNGTPYAIYGHNTFTSVAHYQSIPYATVNELDTRMTELGHYIDDFGAPDLAPYVDFDTALMGEHVGRTGFWNFWDNAYQVYSDAGLLPPKQGDPTDWLLRLPSANQAPGYVPTIPELSFIYSYDPVKYAPYVRYSVDPLNPDFQRWQRATIALMARAGHRRVMLDNVGVDRCWNADCAAGFPAWADTQVPGGAQAILRRPPPSLYADPGFETWARDPQPPFAYLTPGIPWNYGSASAGATLAPSTDAYSGSYSGKLTASAAEDQLQLVTVNNLPGALYHMSFRYKSDVKIRVRLYHDYYHPFIDTILDPSSEWTSSPDFAFVVPAGQNVATVFIAQAPGTAYFDDLLLTPDSASGVPLPQAPVTAGLLAYGDPERSRATLTSQYWHAKTADVVAGLVAAGRAENPDFNVLLNDVGEQLPAADWSLVERVSDEIPRGMWDEGKAPGKYPAGTSFFNPMNQSNPIVIASDTILTSLFTLRHAATRRLPAPFAYQLHTAERDQENADTVLLRLAEGAAYAGGAGIDPNLMQGYFFYTTPALWDAVNAPVQSFFQFTGQHPELYGCLRYAAEVGVAYRAEPTNDPLQNAKRKQIHLFEDLTARGLTADVLGDGDITPQRLSRLKVLVLDHAHRISEAEAMAINGFVASGGVVISTSDTGLLDDLGRTRDALPATALHLPAPSASPLPMQIWVVQGQDIAASDVITALTTPSRPNPSAFPGLAPSVAATVRVASWTSWDRFIVHFTHYDVPRGASGGLVQPLLNTQVTIPLPPDAPTPVPHYVDFWSPEGVMTSQGVTVNGNGTVTFTLPRLRVYTVASIHG